MVDLTMHIVDDFKLSVRGLQPHFLHAINLLSIRMRQTLIGMLFLLKDHC